MGQLEIAGADAVAAVQRITSNDAAKLNVGQAHYSALMLPNGAFVDDLLVYRFAPDHFLLVVNASNVAKDFAWIRQQIAGVGDAVAIDSSSRYALIAVQGPAAREVLQPLTGVELSTIKYYWFAHGEIAGVRGTISRTGYTGEDGYEIFTPPGQAGRVWDALLQSGRGRRPQARGARRARHAPPRGGDAALRQRHRRSDHGSRGGPRVDRVLDEGGLHRPRRPSRRRSRPAFRGAWSGSRCSTAPSRGTVTPCFVDGAAAGVVTSGTQTPFLKKAIGMAYVPASLAPDAEIEIDVRGRPSRARLTPLPFYKRPRSR